MPDTTKQSCLCCVRFGGVNWIPDNSRLSPTENLKSEYVLGNCPIHTGTTDTTRLSCLPVNRRRRNAGQPGSYDQLPDRPHAATLYAMYVVRCKM